MGETGEIFESERRSVIGVPGRCFKFQTHCFVSKSERLKCDLDRKLRPNFALFDPMWNQEREERNFWVTFSWHT